MGYTTRFNIGDTVWYIGTDFVSKGYCECCGRRKEPGTERKVHHSAVDRIEISNNNELYSLRAQIITNVLLLYASKEEANAALEVEDERKNHID